MEHIIVKNVSKKHSTMVRDYLRKRYDVISDYIYSTPGHWNIVDSYSIRLDTSSADVTDIHISENTLNELCVVAYVYLDGLRLGELIERDRYMNEATLRRAI